MSELCPFITEPAHVVFDRLHELHILFLGVRIVETQETRTAKLPGDLERDTDGLGVADVKVTVGLGWKARLHAPAVLTVGDIRRDDLANEVRPWLMFAVHSRNCRR